MRYSKYWRAISGCQQTVSSLRKGLFRVFGLGGEIIAPGGIKSKYGIYAGQGIEAGGPIEIGQITQGEMARRKTGTLAKTGARGYNGYIKPTGGM